MCFSVSQTEKALKDLSGRLQDRRRDYQIKISFASRPNYYFVSGFQYPRLVVMTENEVDAFDWGLIPFWTKTKDDAEKIRRMTLNARCETAYEKPSFRLPIRSRRCVLPVNGFFEWKEVEGEKIPHYIFPKKSPLFFIGGLRDSWKDYETGEVRNTFSIVTTPSNTRMTEIHNSGPNKHRMPLILPEDDIDRWTDPLLGKEDVGRLMKPFDDSEMEAYSISKLANYSRQNRNVPEILLKQ